MIVPTLAVLVVGQGTPFPSLVGFMQSVQRLWSGGGGGGGGGGQNSPGHEGARTFRAMPLAGRLCHAPGPVMNGFFTAISFRVHVAQFFFSGLAEVCEGTEHDRNQYNSLLSTETMIAPSDYELLLKD